MDTTTKLADLVSQARAAYQARMGEFAIAHQNFMNDHTAETRTLMLAAQKRVDQAAADIRKAELTAFANFAKKQVR